MRIIESPQENRGRKPNSKNKIIKPDVVIEKKRLGRPPLPKKRKYKKRKKKRHDAVEVYKKPNISIAMNNMKAGVIRGEMMMLDKVKENATLLSVSLGHELYTGMMKEMGLNKVQMQVFLITASFISVNRRQVDFFGYKTRSVAIIFNKLAKMDYIQMVIKSPATYAVTIKGKRIVDEYEEKFYKLLENTVVYVAKKNRLENKDDLLKRRQRERIKIIKSKSKAVYTKALRKRDYTKKAEPKVEEIKL